MVGFKHAFIVSLVAGVTLGAPILVERQGAGVGQVRSCLPCLSHVYRLESRAVGL